MLLCCLLCTVIPRTLARFKVDLQLQAYTPVTVGLPSAPPPWILASNIPVSLSLSPCPLSSFPTSLVPQPAVFSILLDEKRLSKVVEKGRCGNETGTSSMFSTVTSDEEATGALYLTPVTGQGNHSSPIEVDGSAYFSITRSQYASFFFQLHSIENGLNLDVGLAYGTAEVFASFCVDFEGHSLGKASFPEGFSKYIDPVELVQLIETYSCDGGALYHDLDTNPPAIIIRIHSALATGGVIVTADENHVHGSRLHRAAISGDRITLGENDTITLDFPIEKDIPFDVFSGSVSISGLLCAEEDHIQLGTFPAGNHTILASSLAVECNVTMSRVALTWFAEKDSVLYIGIDPEETKKKMSWYILAGVLVISAAVISVVIGTVFYLFDKAKMNRLRRKEETRHHIPMAMLNGIPLDDQWM